MIAALRRPATYVGTAREAMTVARCALAYPAGIAEAALTTGAPEGCPTHDTPVVLVHGYGHNRSGWFVLDRRLRRAGFTSVHTFNYRPYFRGVEHIAEALRERVEEICALTGRDRVHVVGHSMGGVIARWYVQELGGDARVHTAVTVASPHAGTLAAFCGVGQGALDLRPGSRVIRQLQEGTRPMATRWVAYHSNIDVLIQPATSARLDDPALQATNIFVKDHGHVSMMLSPRVGQSIVHQLEAAEHTPGTATITPLAARGGHTTSTASTSSRSENIASTSS